MRPLQLLVVVGVLYFGHACTMTREEAQKFWSGGEIQKFLAVSTKDVHVGLGPEIKPFKLADEIPEFVNSKPEDKKQWYILAKQIDKIIEMLVSLNEKFQTHSTVTNYYKTGDQLQEKERLFEREIKKIVERDHRVQKIKKELKAFHAEGKPVLQKLKFLIYTKIMPLEEKQEELVGKAYEKKYGFPDARNTAPRYLTFEKREAFETEIKRTEEYKNLEKQLKPLENQRKPLMEKLKAIGKKKNKLSKSLNIIKYEIEQSNKLPKYLKQLMKEIEQLKIHGRRLEVEYENLEAEKETEMNKLILDEMQPLTQKLFYKYKQMVKQNK